MNSYPEILRSACISSMQSQEHEIASLKAQYEAAKMTSFYTAKTKEADREKLVSAIAGRDLIQELKEEALGLNAAADNLLSSATQQKAYASQLVPATAVSASTIQIASNSIVKLAGDIGGIFSVVSAADLASDLYSQSEEINRLMTETAVVAETASQTSMLASIQTSIISAIVFDESKRTQEAFKSILNVFSTDHADALTAFAIAASDLELATANDKKANGTMALTGTSHKAILSSYAAFCKEFNMGIEIQKSTTETASFSVVFDYYQLPFPKETKFLPVDSYCLFLVKESQRWIFSEVNAEAIVKSGKQNRFVKVPGVSAASKTKAKVLIPFSDLYDTDGERIISGNNYAVCILTVFTDEYKKKLNDFSDRLSVPSELFETTTRSKNVAPARASEKKYNISEKKRIMLDSLLNEVALASELANKLEIKVSSLSDLYQQNQSKTALANVYKDKFTSYKKLLDTAIQYSGNLNTYCKDAFEEAVLADKTIAEMVSELNDLVRKLIYAASMINKFSNLVVRKKAQNPLISDELVSMVGVAVKDTSNAVSLTIVALGTTVNAKTLSRSMIDISKLLCQQSLELCGSMSGNKDKKVKAKHSAGFISDIINGSLLVRTNEVKMQEKILLHSDRELRKEMENLNVAKAKLQSLQSGLAAANAAALAE